MLQNALVTVEHRGGVHIINNFHADPCEQQQMPLHHVRTILRRFGRTTGFDFQKLQLLRHSILFVELTSTYQNYTS